MERYKKRVLILKKGPSWDTRVSIEEWIKDNTEDDRERIWRKRREWEEKGTMTVESRLPMEERMRRYKLLDKLNETVRRAGVKARISLKEGRRENEPDVAEDEDARKGQGWRIRKWKGERKRLIKKEKRMKID